MNSFKAYNKDTMGQAYCDGGKLKTDESYSYITSSGKPNGALYTRLEVPEDK